ncbi:MAG: NTP transferase domain-containing protein [Ignavibacteria bacterium]|nr:NTP transferase domain-containing protein [Ignavibacteria bacterium]
MRSDVLRKAVIMAGGFGTRLRPLTMSLPKPMVPLANRPMMAHIVSLLKRHGVSDVVSLLYFQPEHITSYFGDGSAFGVEMKYVTAESDYGTAGSVKNAEPLLSERFIIISGDVLTDVDLTAAMKFHLQRKAMATIVLTRVPQPLQYGIVMTDAEGHITRFLEKPSWGEVFSDTINTGIYILESEVLSLIPEKTDFDFGKDLFPLMLRKNLPLFGYTAEGYWKDVGNLQEYQLAHADVLAGRVNIELEGARRNSAVCGNNLQLSPTAHLDGLVIIGDNVTIGDKAWLSNCVIGPQVTIGAGAKLSGTVVWHDSQIGDFSEITNSVVCNDVTIGNRVTVLDNSFIAEECVIGEGARILSNLKLWPRKTVESEAVLTRSLVQEEHWARQLFTDARISGISNNDMNPDFGAKLGFALGMAFGVGTLVVSSRDDDAVSRIMKRSITAGLMSVGVNVGDLQLTSIPQTRQEMYTGRYVAGFHVRRSPRKSDKTDIILFGKDGRDIPSSQAKTIERYFYGEDIKRVHYGNVGRLSFPERSVGTYIQRFVSNLDADTIRQRKFKLFVDYSFGLAASVFPQILGELSCRELAMNNYVDASRNPDALEETLDESAMIMRSLGYEIGFKFDAGAEKIALVDERGIWYTSLRLLTIVTKLVLDTYKHREPYSIAVPVQATQEIEEIVGGHDVEIIRIRNSHLAMMEATRNEHVVFVGGTRGGFIFPEFLAAADGMFSACRILQMVAQTGYQLSELDRSLPKRHQATASVACPWEVKGRVMRRAMEFSEDKRRLLIDGVKIVEGDRTVLLAPDKEDALFVVTAEANTISEAQSERDRFAQLVAQWRDSN